MTRSARSLMALCLGLVAEIESAPLPTPGNSTQPLVLRGQRRLQLYCTALGVTPTRCLCVISGRRRRCWGAGTHHAVAWFVVRLAIGLAAPERDGRRIATALRVPMDLTRFEPGCLSCTIWTEQGEDFVCTTKSGGAARRPCANGSCRTRSRIVGSARGVTAASHGGIRFRVQAHGARLHRERAQRRPNAAGEVISPIHGMPEAPTGLRRTCSHRLGPPMFRRNFSAAFDCGHLPIPACNGIAPAPPVARKAVCPAQPPTAAHRIDGDDEPMRHLLQAASIALCITAEATAQPAATDPMPLPQPPASASPAVTPLLCESAPGGRRQQCPADTSKGVALTRSTGSSECILGRNWGYDQVSIWVSEGCGGEFLVGAAAVAAAAQATAAPNGDEASDPPIETWGEVEPGKGFLVGRTSPANSTSAPTPSSGT